MIIKKVIPGSESRLTMVDHNETYGRHILEKICKKITILNCLDIGCGDGIDLMVVKKYHPECRLIGIDFNPQKFHQLQSSGIQPLRLNIEKDPLPFKNNSIDFVIANQVFEHIKERFWINHEIFRVLRIGGHLFVGVPNLLSLHNRILMILGFHPTQYKLISAHVSPYSKKDIIKFYKIIGNKFCVIKGFFGAQFYPFPKRIARLLSFFLPNLSFSIFFLIQKVNEYNNVFLEWPLIARLESNFRSKK